MILTPVMLLLLIIVGVPACAGCLYLLVLTLLSARLPVPAPAPARTRFDIIVPAHDESAVIARTVASLLAQQWPRELFRLTVVADNCTDDTAAIARNAGAQVLERTNTEQRGKGYALEYAFDKSAAEGWADAVVIVDADTEATSNMLAAIAARLEAGASAVQVHYGVLNPFASMRTRLMTIALGAFHKVRSRARERMGLSSGLRGNGWCVTHDLLRRVPYRAYSLAEDIEYGVTIGLAGYRIFYVDEAEVRGEMVSSSAAAAKQRQRWEHGRAQMVRQASGQLLAAAIKRPSAVCFDLAMDLLVPPLSWLVLLAVAFDIVAALAGWLVPGLRWTLWLALAATLSIVAYVLRGWQLSGIGPRGLLDLAKAPGYVLWKVIVMFRRNKPGEWVRTEREQQ